jgi:hypothetical protein
MRLTKTLYVKIESGGTGPDFLVAAADIDSLVEMREKTTIGVYQLIEKKVVQGVAHIGKGPAVR